MVECLFVCCLFNLFVLKLLLLLLLLGKLLVYLLFTSRIAALRAAFSASSCGKLFGPTALIINFELSYDRFAVTPQL